MKKGLLLVVVLAVYVLLVVDFIQRPPSENRGASSAEQGEQERPTYPELETGVAPPDPATEEALKQVAEELANLKLENRELDRRPHIKGQDGRDMERIQNPPGDWDEESLRADPPDHGRPGPPLLRDYGLDRDRRASHRPPK